jgi:YgiT-type zinc finger domain-containing protein
MKQPKTQTCVLCGGELRWETREETLSYKDHEKKIKTEGWWCSSCGEAVLSGDALLQSEREFLSLKAEVDGVLAHETVEATPHALDTQTTNWPKQRSA